MGVVWLEYIRGYKLVCILNVGLYITVVALLLLVNLFVPVSHFLSQEVFHRCQYKYDFTSKGFV